MYNALCTYIRYLSNGVLSLNSVFWTLGVHDKPFCVVAPRPECDVNLGETYGRWGGGRPANVPSLLNGPGCALREHILIGQDGKGVAGARDRVFTFATYTFRFGLTLDEEAGDAVDLLSPTDELLGLSASEAPLEEGDGCACLKDIARRDCCVRGESSLFMSNTIDRLLRCSLCRKDLSPLIESFLYDCGIQGSTSLHQRALLALKSLRQRGTFEKDKALVECKRAARLWSTIYVFFFLCVYFWEYLRLEHKYIGIRRLGLGSAEQDAKKKK